LEHNTGFLSHILPQIWLFVELLVNFLDDAFILVTALLSVKTHFDIYSMAVIVGKFIKISFQYYIEGFFF